MLNCHFLLRPFATIASVTLLAGAALAQGMLEDDLRIGIILPEEGDPSAAVWQREIREQVEHAATLALEDHSLNAEMLGVEFEVLFESAAGPEDAVAAQIPGATLQSLTGCQLAAAARRPTPPTRPARLPFAFGS